MFIIKKSNTIKEKISVQVPGDMGKETRADFVVEYVSLPLDEAQDVIKRFTDGEIDQMQVMGDYIVDIDGLFDEKKTKVDYSLEVLPELLNLHYVAKALVDGFLAVQFGKKALQRKN